jgi:hypothetical protein
MEGSRDGDFGDELAALAFELWESAGVLLRLVGSPEVIAREALVEQLELDLIEWDLRGPDWLGDER